VRLLRREVYSLRQAGDLLGVHVPTLRRWLDGYESKGKTYRPVIRPEPTGSEIVTWGEFVEAGYLREYRSSRVSLQRIRPFVDDLRDHYGVPYPLATLKPFVADGAFVVQVQERHGLDSELRLMRYDNGQYLLTPPAEAFFKKIEFAGGAAAKMRPLGIDAPVVIDPERMFGEPTVSGVVRTDILMELFQAGETIEAIARGYELTPDEVQAAIRYESAQRRSAA
jgi:uncharacterized protein (DUF433 family)